MLFHSPYTASIKQSYGEKKLLFQVVEQARKRNIHHQDKTYLHSG